MKKWIAALMAALMLVSAFAFCLAETAEEGPYRELAGEYIFASGAGGWWTSLIVAPDGTFIGHYQDTDFDEGEDHDAICYYCDFTGRLGELTAMDDFELTTQVIELDTGDAEIGAQYVQDRMLMEKSEPYGISLNAELSFYLPGVPIIALPDDLVEWMRMRMDEMGDGNGLPFAALYNFTDEAGFSRMETEEEAAEESAASFVSGLPPVVAEYWASSTLTDKYGTYPAANAFDGNLNTAWAEGAAGSGVGESLSFVIQTNGCAAVEIEIWAGYQKSSQIYGKNARPRDVTVFVDGEPRYFTLADVRAKQSLLIGGLEGRESVTCRLEIGSVYSGTKYEDNCITDIAVAAAEIGG